MLQHLALFHGEALPAHALALLQNAFECSHELIGDNVRWPLARVLALSRANQLRIMQVIVAAVYISYCIFHHSLQVKMIFAAQPLMQVVGAVTCLASLLQHAETDCCSVLCDAYPRMQVILVLMFFLFRIGVYVEFVNFFFLCFILVPARSAQQLAVGADPRTKEWPHEGHLSGVDFGCYSTLACDGGRDVCLSAMVCPAV